jgi:predicted transposase YdaD
LQKYYDNFSNVVNNVEINRGNICTSLPDNELKQSEVYQQAKLEAVPELIKEGLSIEQIARVFKLPLELVQAQIKNSK